MATAIGDAELGGFRELNPATYRERCERARAGRQIRTTVRRKPRNYVVVPLTTAASQDLGRDTARYRVYRPGETQLEPRRGPTVASDRSYRPEPSFTASDLWMADLRDAIDAELAR